MIVFMVMYCYILLKYVTTSSYPLGAWLPIAQKCYMMGRLYTSSTLLFWDQIMESQNALSWNRPMRFIESNSRKGIARAGVFCLEGQGFLPCDANFSGTPSGQGRMRNNSADTVSSILTLSLKYCLVASCYAKTCRSSELMLVLAVSG